MVPNPKLVLIFMVAMVTIKLDRISSPIVTENTTPFEIFV